MRSKLGWSFVLAAHACFEHPATCQAQPAPATSSARELFDLGTEHFRNGEFERAVADFEAAYRIKPHPAVLYNLGRAYAACGRPVEAVNALERYLNDGDAAPTVERRSAASDLLAAQRRQLGAVSITTREPGIAVSIDGHPVGETPLPRPILVTRGEHAVVGLKSGFAAVEINISIESAQTSEVELKLAPIAATSVARESSPALAPIASGARVTDSQKQRDESTSPIESRGGRSVGVALVATGIAAAGLGSYFALRARDSWSERNRHCPAGECDAQAVNAWKDAKREALGADLAFGLGVLAVGAGAYILLVHPSHAHHPSTTRLQLNFGPREGVWFASIEGRL